MITFVHILDGVNFGDSVCSPRNYFPEWRGFSEVDFRQLAPGTWPIVVGGGGMLHPGVDTWLESVSRKRPTVVWGVGLNYHADAPPSGWPAFLKHCKLAGVRDAQTSFEWLPDPTCLHPFLDTLPAASEPGVVVAYSHFERPIALPGVREEDNRCAPRKSLDSVLRFLASGDTVVTNSYHGALWALFLGRRVVLWKPFSTRFFSGLPVKLPVAKCADDLRRILSTPSAPADSSFLLRARRTTYAFREKVRGLLQI